MLIICQLLAQGSDAVSFGWKEVSGASGAAILALFCWLWLSNRICTQANADKRLEEWKGLYAQEREAREHAEQRLFDSLTIAGRTTEITATAVETATKKKGA